MEIKFLVATFIALCGFTAYLMKSSDFESLTKDNKKLQSQKTQISKKLTNKYESIIKIQKKELEGHKATSEEFKKNNFLLKDSNKKLKASVEVNQKFWIEKFTKYESAQKAAYLSHQEQVLIKSKVKNWPAAHNAYKQMVALKVKDPSTSKIKTQLNKHILENEFGMVFLKIQKGWFKMGSRTQLKTRTPDESYHKVILNKDYYIGQCEITQGQWKAIMGKNPAVYKDSNKPVESVSWKDIQDFLKVLNSKSESGSYRLPTEAEWEYACLAIKDGVKPLYPNSLDSMSWYESNCKDKSPQQVKTKSANTWHLHDLLGNVSEWVQDGYEILPRTQQKDPKGPINESFKVVKGGNWQSEIKDCRAAFRRKVASEYKSSNIGFRLIYTAPKK